MIQIIKKVVALRIAGDKYRNTLRVLQLWGSACFKQLAASRCRSLVAIR